VPPVMEAPVRDPERPETALSTDVAELQLLVGEMDDELTKYRKREAVWASLVVHVLAFLVIIFAPKWLPKSAVIVPNSRSTKDNSIVLAPPDQQRVKPPKTDMLSDKNRVAQSRTPVPDKELLRKLRDASRPGPPANKPAEAPAPPAQAAQQAPPQPNPQQQAAGQNALQAPQPPQQTAQLHTPATGGPSPFKTAGPGIQHALDDLGANHGTTHMAFGGDYGPNVRANTNMKGDVEILSDTRGVDFGPYLQRVLFAIKKNWYNLIPEVARPPMMKKGSLIIQFSIMKQGNVQGMFLQSPSGDVSLDRAAWGGITYSDPFEPLPSEFSGDFLQLRIKFIYNSTVDDLR
jgi:outer membrane biosynthesis protein TonB